MSSYRHHSVTKNEEDGGVMGHEMAHASARHGSQRYSLQPDANVMAGAICHERQGPGQSQQ